MLNGQVMQSPIIPYRRTKELKRNPDPAEHNHRNATIDDAKLPCQIDNEISSCYFAPPIYLSIYPYDISGAM